MHSAAPPEFPSSHSGNPAAAALEPLLPCCAACYAPPASPNTAGDASTGRLRELWQQRPQSGARSLQVRQGLAFCPLIAAGTKQMAARLAARLMGQHRQPHCFLMLQRDCRGQRHPPALLPGDLEPGRLRRLPAGRHLHARRPRECLVAGQQTECCTIQGGAVLQRRMMSGRADLEVGSHARQGAGKVAAE